MKDIRGHKSWTLDELVQILDKGGSYCCPTLPHYRYARVQRNCQELKRRGLITKSGCTPCGVNYTPTDLFRQWRKEKAEGATTLGPVKWHKQYKREGRDLV